LAESVCWTALRELMEIKMATNQGSENCPRQNLNATSIALEMIENQIRETWHRRHELIRGG
jgi:hypothetical protein